MNSQLSVSLAYLILAYVLDLGKLGCLGFDVKFCMLPDFRSTRGLGSVVGCDLSALPADVTICDRANKGEGVMPPITRDGFAGVTNVLLMQEPSNFMLEKKYLLGGAHMPKDGTAEVHSENKLDT